MTEAGWSSNEQLLVAGAQPGVGPDGQGQRVWAVPSSCRGHGGEQVKGPAVPGKTGLVTPDEAGDELTDRFEVTALPPGVAGVLVAPEHAVELSRDRVEADGDDRSARMA